MAGRRHTPETLRASIAAADFEPLYLIHGADEAEKTSLAAAFGSAIPEDVRAFNFERRYGGDASTTIASAGAETNTLAIPTFRGQWLDINADTVGTGTRAIASTTKETTAVRAI